MRFRAQGWVSGRLAEAEGQRWARWGPGSVLTHCSQHAAQMPDPGVPLSAQGFRLRPALGRRELCAQRPGLMPLRDQAGVWVTHPQHGCGRLSCVCGLAAAWRAGWRRTREGPSVRAQAGRQGPRAWEPHGPRALGEEQLGHGRRARHLRRAPLSPPGTRPQAPHGDSLDHVVAHVRLGPTHTHSFRARCRHTQHRGLREQLGCHSWKLRLKGLSVVQ